MKAATVARLLFAHILYISLLIPPTSCSATAETKETWLGVYFGGRKIGYTSIRDEDASYKGKPGHKSESKSVMALELLGNKVTQDVQTLSYSDSSYTPLYQEYTISSNGSATVVTADYQPGKILCTLKSGGSATSKTVDVPPGAKLISDTTTATQGKQIAPGTKDTFYFLNPLTLTLDKTTVESVGRARVALNGKSYATIKVLISTSLGNVTSWEANGEIIKSEMSLGIAMYPEPKGVAMNMASKQPAFVVEGAVVAAGNGYTPPKDFAVATAIAVAKPISNPRAVRDLTVTIRGIDDPKLIISDARQQGKPVSGKAGEYRVHIKAEAFDAAHSVPLPIESKELQLYLQRAPYLETDSPEIIETARKIRGDEVSAYKVAIAIRDWVHEKMTPDYSIGVPRSCTDVLQKPRGVCRDYATLFCGLARAAGVPARVAAGILYADGKFFYHAWAECWVGQWVSIDPTLKGNFVDATHVKFAQGNVTEMFAVAGIVGRVKLEVNEVR